MADLDPLIRFRKHELDEKQKFLARLYEEANKLLQQREGILRSIEKEMDVMRGEDFQPFMAISGFGTFLQSSKEKIKKIEHEEKKLDTRIEIAVADMRNSFGELKKVEITHARRLEEERKKLQAKEDALFEEIGLQIYAKNKE